MPLLRGIPLVGQFLMGSILGTVFALLLIVFVSRIAVDDALRDTLMEERLLASRTIASTTVDAMIVRDRPLLQTIAEQVILENPRILSIRMEDAEANILARSGITTAKDVMDISEDIVYHGDTYGSITFIWSMSEFENTIAGATLQIITWSAVVLLTLIMLLAIGMHRLVLRPVLRLNRYLMDIREGKDPEPLSMQQSPEFQFLSAEAEHIRELLTTEHELRDDATKNSHRLQLLLQELDHRVKNVLASIIALVRQSGEQDMSTDEMIEGLSNRIMSIARSHEALSSAGWEGFDLDSDLRGILDTDRFGISPERIRFSGEPIKLSNRCATPLCMALSELQMNALKHGALQGEEGFVDLKWTKGDEHIAIQWTETGGPAITPKRETDSGLGMHLIRGLVEYELGGSLQMEFKESGLEAMIWIPFE